MPRSNANANAESNTFETSSLDDGKLGGGNVESVDIRGQAGESLLGAIWSVRLLVSCRIISFATLHTG